MARLSGNDISDYQIPVDWQTYAKNTNFVLIKATQKNDFTTKSLKDFQKGARDNNIPLGYYHFAGMADPIAEADYFLQQIGELREGEMLLLDYEPSTIGIPQVQAHVDWCKKFLDRVQEKTGVKALIYMNESTCTSLDWTNVVNGGYGLWIAKYLYNPNPDYTGFNTGKWKFAAMYQWTSSQKVPGILNGKGNVDGDVFYGDVTTFKKYGYVKPTSPTPPVDYKALYEAQVAETKRVNDLLTQEKTLSAQLQSKIDNAKRDLS